MKTYSFKDIINVYVLGDCHGEFKEYFHGIKNGLDIKSEDEDKPHPKELERQARKAAREQAMRNAGRPQIAVDANGTVSAKTYTITWKDENGTIVDSNVVYSIPEVTVDRTESVIVNLYAYFTFIFYLSFLFCSFIRFYCCFSFYFFFLFFSNFCCSSCFN